MNCSVDFRRRQQARYIKKVRQNLDITLGAPLRTLFGNQYLKISYIIIKSKIKMVLFQRIFTHRGICWWDFPAQRKSRPKTEKIHQGYFYLSTKIERKLSLPSFYFLLEPPVYRNRKGGGCSSSSGGGRRTFLLHQQCSIFGSSLAFHIINPA